MEYLQKYGKEQKNLEKTLWEDFDFGEEHYCWLGGAGEGRKIIEQINPEAQVTRLKF